MIVLPYTILRKTTITKAGEIVSSNVLDMRLFSTSSRRFVAVLVLAMLSWGGMLASPASLVAQDSAGESEADESGEVSLDTSQQAISRRYKRFEETLLRMAELMRKTDPDRAALLRRVIGKSKEQMITVRMDRLVELLDSNRLGDALQQQDDLIVELISLLDLLGSEDRAKEIEEEKQRLKDLIRNVDRLIGKEKSLRAGTERGGSMQNLQQRQADLADETNKLGKKIDSQDSEKNKKSSPQKENGDNPSQDGKPTPGDQQQGKQSDGKNSQGDGKSQEGGQSSGDQQQPSTPGREQIEQARKAMQDAAEKLKQKQRDGAAEEQTDAIAKLQQAKEKLEEILRQLREEERERMLTKLEDRFQQMLATQLAIYDKTVRLGKVPKDDRETRHVSQSKELSRREMELVIDAGKALALLQEEGSSVAFPEAIQQMVDDMRIIVGRLDLAQVDELTQGIEEDVIEALEEVIEALQREIEKGKSDQQQQQQQQSGGQGDPALVDNLAELKMLRSLQLRINRRTKRLGRLIEGEQSEDQDVIDQLRDLSERQSRIQKATYDLATGKNQ